MHQEYDRSSKWLIEHYGKAMLRLAGVENVVSCKALQAELVQPRQLPDGLLEVRFANRSDADLFLMEIATYPDARVTEQVLRDTLLVVLDRRKVPEVVTLVLHPKGKLVINGILEMTSQLGLTALHIRWRVVELWKLAAADLLATNELGLVPWVPLTDFQGPPEPILHECRARIDRQAQPEEHANLLAVIQVLAGLRYNTPELLAIFGGASAMIESPVLKEFMERAEIQNKQDDIHRFLTARFKAIPADLVATLRTVRDLERLNALIELSATCTDLDAFRAGMA